MASAALLLAPTGDRSVHGKPFRLAVDEITGHRQGWREIKRGKTAGVEAWLANKGELDEFNIGEFTGDESEQLLQICKEFGGHFLLIWTYGQTIQALLAQGLVGQEPFVRELNLRLDAPQAGRRPETLDEFGTWFQNWPFSPDLEALRAQFVAPRISVQDWFQAFEISGAHDLDGSTSLELWDDFEHVSSALLRGKPADPARIRKLNKEIGRTTAEGGLRSKPYKQAGRTARLIAEAFRRLCDCIGLPQSEAWQQRCRAAGLYRELTDCPTARTYLTAGKDSSGLGQSASFARLLAHYPAELMRDALFHTLAGEHAAQADGHAHAECFFHLAEQAHKAGFSLAVFPAGLRRQFRERFGVVASGDDAGGDRAGEWAAEVFVDLRGTLKTKPATPVRTWFKKARTDGWCLRADADGSWQLQRFERGSPKDDRKVASGRKIKSRDVARAAKTLDLAAVFAAMGLPDLLEAGRWRETALDRDRGNARDETLLAQATRLWTDPPYPQTVRNAQALLPDFDREIGGEGLSVIHLVIPGSTEAYRKGLMQDLLGRGCVHESGTVWGGPEEVCAYTEGHLSKACLVRVLGDLVPGTQIVLHVHDGPTKQYRIDPAAEPVRLTSADVCQEWDYAESFAQEVADALDREWAGEVEQPIDEHDFGKFLEAGLADGSIVERTLLERDDYPHVQVDLSGFSLPFESRLQQQAQEFAEHGMQSLGDLVCLRMSSVVMRGFAAEAGNAYGIILIPATGNPILELYTLFEDGSSLTTTTRFGTDPSPEKKIHYQWLEENSSLQDVWARHHDYIAEQKRQSNLPCTVSGSLVGLAESVEEFLQRTLGIFSLV